MSCARCLFPAVSKGLCLGHSAAAEGRRVLGTTTQMVKEPHLRGVQVVFIGFWKGHPNDIIAELASTIDTDAPRILELGSFEVEWDTKVVS